MICQKHMRGHISVCIDCHKEALAIKPDPRQTPLSRLVPIAFADASDIVEYAKSMTIGPHLPGVRDVAMYTKDQLHSAVNAATPREAVQAEPSDAPDTKEMRAVAALLAAMHEQGLEGSKVREAMLWALHGVVPEASQVAPREAVEPVSDEGLTIIAACRDAFPIPPHGSPLEEAWMLAINDPENVPAYLREIAADQKEGNP